MKSDKKQPVEKGDGLLELKIGAFLHAPTKRAVVDLHEIAYQCNLVKNKAAEWIIKWVREHPDEVAGKALVPGEVAKELYHEMVVFTPNLPAQMVNQCVRRVVKELKSRVPWNHYGKAKYQWKATADYEIGPKCYRASIIPVSNQTAKFCYNGDLSTQQKTGAVVTKVLKCGESSAVMASQLFSNASGRAERNAIFRVHIGDLSRGNKKILQSIARGKLKLRDSIIVYKEGKGNQKKRKSKNNGAWYFQLCYNQPRADLNLDKSNVAVLAPTSDAPMVIHVKANERIKWDFLRGGVSIMRQAERLEKRRMELRKRYSTASSARRGHGRGRFERDIRPATRQMQNMVENYIDTTVARIIAFCTRYDCGKIEYYEPTLGSRVNSWFIKNSVQHDWTNFLRKLKYKCWLYGIDLDVERLKIAK